MFQHINRKKTKTEIVIFFFFPTDVVAVMANLNCQLDEI